MDAGVLRRRRLEYYARTHLGGEGATEGPTGIGSGLQRRAGIEAERVKDGKAVQTQDYFICKEGPPCPCQRQVRVSS
jgi:hypothetical protein